jgi:hypothetical protein
MSRVGSCHKIMMSIEQALMEWLLMIDVHYNLMFFLHLQSDISSISASYHQHQQVHHLHHLHLHHQNHTSKQQSKHHQNALSSNGYHPGTFLNDCIHITFTFSVV